MFQTPPEIIDITNSAANAINELTCAEIDAQFTDLEGNAIAKSSLESLTFTLRSPFGATAINGRDDVSVLDANGGTVSDTCELTLALDPEDMVVLADRRREGEVAFNRGTLTWTWRDSESQLKTGSKVFLIPVRNV